MSGSGISSAVPSMKLAGPSPRSARESLTRLRATSNIAGIGSKQVTSQATIRSAKVPGPQPTSKTVLPAGICPLTPLRQR